MKDNSSEDAWDQAAEWERVAGENQDESARGDWILGGPGQGEAVPEPGSGQPEPVVPTPRRLLRAVPTKLFVAAGTLVVVAATVGLTAVGGSSDQPGATSQADRAAQDDRPPVTQQTEPADLPPTAPTVPVTPADGDGDGAQPSDGDGAEPDGGDGRGRSGDLGPSGSGVGEGRSAEPRESGQRGGNASPPDRPAPVTSRAVDPPATTAPAYTAPRAGITVRMVSYATGKSASVSGGSGADGARVVQSGSAGDTAQHWRILAGRSGCYHLVNVGTGKAFDNTDGTSVNGMQMQQWTYDNGNPNQIWCFTGLGDSRYSIKNMTSGFLLDIRDGGTADGVAVQQWNADPANPNANQTWRLIQVS
ncbi:RICIN domain-containing protein [Micromonospora sp. NPDC051296]|uniref:RICIN domain-containing protein n=1 Tax=Micromonospora sp. NPDC051296 TaxID=3155046 RepID=UPI003417DF14